ncbi:hypothetical protein AcV7_009792 [Taiwanofungus camphoratus]|nr:hypothetical protein AcV7_009792 [Antrodia cinnamomea]
MQSPMQGSVPMNSYQPHGSPVSSQHAASPQQQPLSPEMQELALAAQFQLERKESPILVPEMVQTQLR